jgi:hypothetical protein
VSGRERHQPGMCIWYANAGPEGEPIGLVNCPNPATMRVGLPAYELCDRCAALPTFERYRKRVPVDADPRRGAGGAG